MTNRKALVKQIAAIWVVLAVMLWLLVLSPWNLPMNIPEPLQTDVGTSVHAIGNQRPARLSVHDATAEDLGRLGEAVMAFAAADLELPALDIWFHADRGPCGEHHGLFRATSESLQIRICSSEIETVYEHELAHAWVTVNVEEHQRSAFMNLRGLEHWADQDVPWNRRGTEWAAVVIQQGLNGLPLPPALSNETKSRLDSFELLTGKVAPVLTEWIAERDVPCPERPTDLSQQIADVTGRFCTLSSSVAVIGTSSIGQTLADPNKSQTFGQQAT